MGLVKKSDVAAVAGGVNQAAGQVVESKSHKSTWYELQKLVFGLLCIATFALYVFGNTPFLSYFPVQELYKTQQFCAGLFIYFLIFTVLMGIIFFYLLDKFKLSEMRETASLVITYPEKQDPKIRKWASTHYGLQLGNCLRTGRSPAPTAGEASSVPHTLHFLYEVIEGGRPTKYAQISNSLFKDNNVFWLVSVGDFQRNSPSTFWWSEPKGAMPIPLEATSLARKGLRAVSHNDIEDEEEVM